MTVTVKIPAACPGLKNAETSDVNSVITVDVVTSATRTSGAPAPEYLNNDPLAGFDAFVVSNNAWKTIVDVDDSLGQKDASYERAPTFFTFVASCAVDDTDVENSSENLSRDETIT